jgi:hypothetical protein
VVDLAASFRNHLCLSTEKFALKLEQVAGALRMNYLMRKVEVIIKGLFKK